MKRADQHPVKSHSQQAENFDPITVISNESGIDTPSEKDDIDQSDTPTMGALPVDNMGSRKPGEWKDSGNDESHTKEAKKDENEKPGEIIATGSGPDPEHADESGI